MNVANGRLRRQSNTSSVQLANLNARLAGGGGGRGRSAPAPFGLRPASAPSGVTDARPVPRPPCLALRGTVLVLSGQDAPLKSHLHSLVSAMGGRYSRDLDPRTVTHLVVDAPAGDKYEYWRRHLRLGSGWAVDCHVVTSGWVDACGRDGRRADEAEWGLGGERSGRARKRRRVAAPAESRQRVEAGSPASGRERLPEGLRRRGPLEICEVLMEDNKTDRGLFRGRCFILVGFEEEILALRRRDRKGLNGGGKDSSSNLLEVEATRLDSSASGRNGHGESVPHFSSVYHPGSLKNSLAALLRRAGATILHRPNEFVDVVLVNDGISAEVYGDVREFCACHPRGPLGATLDWALGCLHGGRWVDPAFPEEPRPQDEGAGDAGGFDYRDGDDFDQTDAAVLGIKDESNVFSSETTRRANGGRPGRRPGPVSADPNGPGRGAKREAGATSERGDKKRPRQQAVRQAQATRPRSVDLFRGNVFSVVGLSSVDDGAYNFDQTKMESTIARHGGLILDANLLRAVERDERRRLLGDPAAPDERRRRYFAVTAREFRVDMAAPASHPLLSSLSRLVGVETVSPVWVSACVGEGQPFEPADCPALFRPPRWPVRLLPAGGAPNGGSRRPVVSVTGLVDSTRWAVKHALLLVGAEFTDTLTRRNTHLIAKDAKGGGEDGGRSQKLVKADEWGISIVGVEWLHRVMRYGLDGADGVGGGPAGGGRVKEEEAATGSERKAPGGDAADRVRSSLEGGGVGAGKGAAAGSVAEIPEETAAVRRDPPPVPAPARRGRPPEGTDGGDGRAEADGGPTRARVSLFQSVMSSSQAGPSGKKKSQTCARASEVTAHRKRNGGETPTAPGGARADRGAASPPPAQNVDSNTTGTPSRRRGKRDRSPRGGSPPSAVGGKAPQSSPLRPAEGRGCPDDGPGPPPPPPPSSLTPGPGSSPGRRLQFALDVLGAPPPPAASAPGAGPAGRTRRGKRDRGRSPAPSQNSRGSSCTGSPADGSPADETQATLGTVNVGAYAAGLGFARRGGRAGGGRCRLVGGQLVPASQVDEAEDNGESQVIWFAGGRCR